MHHGKSPIPAISLSKRKALSQFLNMEMAVSDVRDVSTVTEPLPLIQSEDTLWEPIGL